MSERPHDLPRTRAKSAGLSEGYLRVCNAVADIAAAGSPADISTIAQRSQLAPATVGAYVVQLVHAGMLRRLSHGRYVPRQHAGQSILSGNVIVLCLVDGCHEAALSQHLCELHRGMAGMRARQTSDFIGALPLRRLMGGRA